MPRKLDFIVAGVARTGTTAIARYLSAIDSFHCGVELFSQNRDHSTLLAPDCFTDLSDPRAAMRGKFAMKPRHVTNSLTELARKGSAVTIYGNKTPNYIHRLQGILDELDGGKAVLAWRGIRETAGSYQRRSTNPNDNFGEGRKGLFAALDMMLLTQVVANLKDRDLLIVPNRHLADDWEGATRQIAAHIAPGQPITFSAKVVDALTRDRDRKDKARETAAVAFSKVDDLAISLVEDAGVDTLFDRPGPFLLSEIRADLPRILAKLPPDLLAFAQRRAQAHPNPAVAAYFPKWKRNAEAALQTVQRQTEGAT